MTETKKGLFLLKNDIVHLKYNPVDELINRIDDILNNLDENNYKLDVKCNRKEFYDIQKMGKILSPVLMQELITLMKSKGMVIPVDVDEIRW